jgi:hypothetical protein
VIAAGGEDVCSIEPWSEEVDEADARLIAAAPDMLEKIARLVAALREIEEVLDDLADADDGRPNNEMKMLVLVRAALKGEPQ